MDNPSSHDPSPDEPAPEDPPHRDPDLLADFTKRSMELVAGEPSQRTTMVVWTSGAGPAVVVMPEMPGISPDVIRLARWISDAGFTVYLPSLFGTDGAVPSAEYGRSIIERACVSREFRAFAGGGTSPIVARLRALARVAHDECGGAGVGAVGLCFTGNFALTMMLEPSVIAAVINHPSLPLDDPAGLELSSDDGAALRERIDRDDLHVLGYRFDTDRWCTAERFAAYSALLGDRFDGRVLPGEVANPNPPSFFSDVVGTPHSVVTAHLVDTAGHPTIVARDEILGYLTTSLLAPPPS
ncbi:MAG TPA: dienelactone hydrolase family protein [Microthrixaceae bacterium]|jgi:dienelactone hydrolase|nr:dienelactone hydrolase family protein [Microthrixaceae bacterium]